MSAGKDEAEERFPCERPACRGTFVRVEGRLPGGRPRRYCGSKCRRLAARDAQWSKAEAAGRERGQKEGRDEAWAEVGRLQARYHDLVVEATALARRWDGTAGQIRATSRRGAPPTDAEIAHLIRDGFDPQVTELWKTIQRLST